MPQPEYVQPPLFLEFSSSPGQDALPDNSALAEEKPTKANPNDAFLEEPPNELPDEPLDEPDNLEPYEPIDEQPDELPIDDLLDEPNLDEQLDEFLDELLDELADESTYYSHPNPIQLDPALLEPPDEPLYEPSDESLDDRHSAPDWLDEFSLKTVLDMLAVIDSAEELALLEALTPLQKRQVWDITPEFIKLKLKQLRSGNWNNSTGIETLDDLEDLENPEDLEDWADLAEAEDTETEELHSALSNPPFPNETKAFATHDFDANLPPLNQPIPTVGDFVVLNAKPKLTAAELTAIWTVLDVHEGYARIQTKGMTRHYPIAWMVIYPKSALEEDA